VGAGAGAGVDDEVEDAAAGWTTGCGAGAADVAIAPDPTPTAKNADRAVIVTAAAVASALRRSMCRSPCVGAPPVATPVRCCHCRQQDRDEGRASVRMKLA
jgi:hypothetical protein